MPHDLFFFLFFFHKIILLDTVLRENSANSFTCNTRMKNQNTRDGEKKKRPWRPCFFLQTAQDGEWTSTLEKVDAAALKSTACFSVPEQNVPGGLAVSGASSSLQVTGVSSRAAVLRVRAAHGLLKRRVRLDYTEIYCSTQSVFSSINK